MPVAEPLTTPAPLMVAAPPLMLQAPPVVASASAVVAPTHTVIVPVIAAGALFTVKIAVVIQPVVAVYVIVQVPAPVALTIPEEAPIVAIPAQLQLHVPKVVAELSVEVLPTHKDNMPDMGSGSGSTVTTVVTLQPLGRT